MDLTIFLSYSVYIHTYTAGEGARIQGLTQEHGIYSEKSIYGERSYKILVKVHYINRLNPYLYSSYQ